MSQPWNVAEHRREALALFRQSSPLPPKQVEAFVDYHNRGMIGQLTRHVTQGDVRRTMPDPLMPPPKGGYPTIFIPHDHSVKRIRQEIEQSMRTIFRQENEAAHARGEPLPHASVNEDVLKLMRQIRVSKLPKRYADRQALFNRLRPEEHGILYVPHRYVVPSGDKRHKTELADGTIIETVTAGRFNRFFGWDTPYTAPAVEKLDLLLEMIDGQKYCIDHYGGIGADGLPFGGVPNINTTYGMRAQPATFTHPIRLAYDRMLREGVPDGLELQQWLAGNCDSAERLHRHFSRALLRSADTGLSHFYDEGTGPSREVEFCERHEEAGVMKTHFDLMREFLQKAVADPGSHPLPYDPHEFLTIDGQLTEKAYRADAAVRASGLDICGAWGPFGLGILDHDQVYLNALLVRLERDIRWMHETLGHPQEAAEWNIRAGERVMQMRELMWDEGIGCFQDIRNRPEADGSFRRLPYLHASHFYALFADVATPEQAIRMVNDVLPKLLMEYGVAASAEQTGSQWDHPFVWGPLNVTVVEGLRRYAAQWQDSYPQMHGWDALADSIALRFCANFMQGLRLEWDANRLPKWLEAEANANPTIAAIRDIWQATQPVEGEAETLRQQKDSQRQQALAHLFTLPEVDVAMLRTHRILRVRGSGKEKYNGYGGTDTGQFVTNGYAENVDGFGWTLGAVKQLMSGLSPECKALLHEQSELLPLTAATFRQTKHQNFAQAA